jgi:MoaA/NifB/PqqE/SkfB family radical SAM enzyme
LSHQHGWDFSNHDSIDRSSRNTLFRGDIVRDTFADVDEAGNLKVPAGVAKALGFQPGSRIKLEPLSDRLILRRPTTHLARVYIEPTTVCNLQCRTCMRNAWDEPIGHMEWHTFSQALKGIQGLGDRPAVFFGGLGEPLTHPDFLSMVREVKHLGASVEAITNGMLIDEMRAEALLDAGLDTLWVSIDGASPECYVDVRTEGDLPRVIENLERLRDLKIRRRSKTPEIGISFVAMRRNLTELPEVFRLEHRIAARKFLVTNVYPHTPELLQEILYRRSIGEALWSRSQVRMARMDPNREAAAVLEAMIQGLYGPRLEGVELLWPADTCPFVLRGSICVRWDGQVSPCLPLLHTHASYLENRLRTTTAYTVGSVHEQGLREIWMSPEYVALRKRLEEFGPFEPRPVQALNHRLQD